VPVGAAHPVLVVVKTWLFPKFNKGKFRVKELLETFIQTSPVNGEVGAKPASILRDALLALLAAAWTAAVGTGTLAVEVIGPTFPK
jgi:hypothetical protein